MPPLKFPCPRCGLELTDLLELRRSCGCTESSILKTHPWTILPEGLEQCMSKTLSQPEGKAPIYLRWNFSPFNGMCHQLFTNLYTCIYVIMDKLCPPKIHMLEPHLSVLLYLEIGPWQKQFRLNKVITVGPWSYGANILLRGGRDIRMIKPSQELPQSTSHVWHSEEVAGPKPRKEPSSNTKFAGTLIRNSSFQNYKTNVYF